MEGEGAQHTNLINKEENQVEAKLEDDDENKIPSLAEVFEEGYPPEYIPIMVISFIICIIITVLFLRSANEHRRYMTKFTMQTLCTVGVLLTFPVFSTMYFSGMVVPKAMPKVTFIAETYEAVSLLFFLRLIFTYLGGKKQTAVHLKNHTVALCSPACFCCMPCLPHVRVSRKYLFVNEIFIIQLVVLQLVLGYIDLLIGLDESHSYPAALIEEEYSHSFHIFILFSLALAVVGLSGIYNCAEEQLSHYQIFRKFILYKVFVTVVKLEELAFSFVVMTLIKRYDVHIARGAFPTHLRVHFWCYFLVLVETVLVFPFCLRAYSVRDYPKPGENGQKQELELELLEREGLVEGESGKYEPLPDATVELEP